MREIIYYPGFEVEDPNWLKFALLYVDRLRPIIPYTVAGRPECFSEGFWRVMRETDLIDPIDPLADALNESAGLFTTETSLPYLVSEAVSAELASYLENPEKRHRVFPNRRGRDLLDTWARPSSRKAVLYSAKYDAPFADFCLSYGLAEPCSDGLLVAKQLAEVYMTAFAEFIAADAGLEIITDRPELARFLNRKAETNALFTGSNLRLLKRRFNLVLPQNLAAVPLEKIIDFRNSGRVGFMRSEYLRAAEDCLRSEPDRRGEDEYALRLLSDDMARLLVSLGLTAATAAVQAVTILSHLENGLNPGSLALAGAAAVLGIREITREQDNVGTLIKKLRGKSLTRRYALSVKKLTAREA